MPVPSAFVLTAVVATVLATLLTGCSGGEPGVDEPAGEVVSATAGPQPFGADGHFGGTAHPRFPPGEPGELSVVEVGRLEGSRQLDFVLAFRNNTGEPMGEERLRVVFHKDGETLETTYTLPTSPAVLRPGQVGLASVAFVSERGIREGNLDDQGIEVSVEPNGTLAEIGASGSADLPLTVEETTNQRGRITGSATNRTGGVLEGPFTVMAYCFSDGRPSLARLGSSDRGVMPTGPLADGESIRFDMGHSIEGCEEYAVAVHGLRS